MLRLVKKNGLASADTEKIDWIKRMKHHCRRGRGGDEKIKKFLAPICFCGYRGDGESSGRPVDVGARTKRDQSPRPSSAGRHRGHRKRARARGDRP